MGQTMPQWLYLFKLKSAIYYINFTGEKKQQYRPFIVNGTQVGVVPPIMVTAIATEPDLFLWADDGIHLSSSLTTYAERTERMAEFLQRCRHDNSLITLAGWRNEVVYFIQ